MSDAPPDMNVPEPPVTAPWWRRPAAWLARHERLLWWLHSAWALAFGVGVMWLGARDARWLRLTYGYVAFIWASSLVLPWLAARDSLPLWLRRTAGFGINYFNKNFYQQILFFVLPVYWRSTTVGTRNTWFIVLVATSAVLSTFDVVYDRVVSTRRRLTAAFFAFNVFAAVNVILPLLWGVETVTATRVSVAVSALGFATLRSGVEGRAPLRWGPLALISGIVLLVVTEMGRPLLPPVPLALGATTFGEAVSPATLTIPNAVTAWPASTASRLAVVTSIAAPVGLHDRVRLIWKLDDVVVTRSRGIPVVGGRRGGYRVWTVVALPRTEPGQTIVLDIETEHAQLIGRRVLPVR